MSTQVDLPHEIWTEIFKCCEADSLAADLPLVCKLFAQLTDVNELWRIKCMQKGLDLTLKKSNETYKAFYFFQHLEFFPLFGIEIGKTTEAELLAIKGAISQNTSRYVTIKQVNFWYNNPDSVFKMMYLVKGIYVLPEEWQKFGLHYEYGWNSLLVYLKEYNHNYQIKALPSQEMFQDRECFSASVETIGKCKDVYFSVTFAFNYTPGNVNTKGTLYSISVNTSSNKEQEKEWQRYYEKNVFNTKGYVIENEEQVREALAKQLPKIAPTLRRKIRVVKPKPKIIPLVAVDGVQIPNDIWPIIFRHTDEKSLAINVPQVCMAFNRLSSDDRVWEEKCLKAGRDMKGRYEDETWKHYYFTKLLPLFPLFGCVIDQTTEKELLARPDATKAERDQYATINKVNFWFNNSDKVFKMMYIVRGIYPIPDEWLNLGINFEKSYVEYLEFFKYRLGNYQVTNAPSQQNHSFMPKASFNASVNVIARHNETFYMMTFMFGYVPGNTQTKNTLYSISVRGAYNPSEVGEWRTNYEDHVIIHKDPVEDPELPADNPEYNTNQNNHWEPAADVDVDFDELFS